jgi:hypothetical protein
VQYNNRDLRLMLPNFYYDQEDFFRERQQGKALALDRAAPGSGNRLWSQQSDESYDVDCGLCRHLKRTPVSLRFPGTKKGYWDFKSNHVGRHSQPVRGGQGDFNTNGDYFRRKSLRPRIAAMFDMATADPIPTRLIGCMADKKPVG